MKLKQLLHSLLLTLILSACTKPPEGTYVSGGMKKRIKTEAGSQIVEAVRYSGHQETLTFHSSGKLSWSKVEGGQPLHSEGQWEMKRDDAGLTNIHATFNYKKNKITYILGQRKNDDGEEELPLKYIQVNDGREEPVGPGNRLNFSAFTKVKE